METGSAEAKAMESVTWREVADDIGALRANLGGGMRLERNLVSASYAARVAGVSSDTFYEVIGMLGYRTMNGRLERREIRAVLMKLLVRTRDAETKDQIRNAIHEFADEPEDTS